MNRRFKDNLPEEGDFIILDKNHIMKLTCCGWTFFWEGEDKIDGEVVYDYRLEKETKK